jgi:hypothetical protein
MFSLCKLRRNSSASSSLGEGVVASGFLLLAIEPDFCFSPDYWLNASRIASVSDTIGKPGVSFCFIGMTFITGCGLVLSRVAELPLAVRGVAQRPQ